MISYGISTSAEINYSTLGTTTLGCLGPARSAALTGAAPPRGRGGVPVDSPMLEACGDRSCGGPVPQALQLTKIDADDADTGGSCDVAGQLTRFSTTRSTGTPGDDRARGRSCVELVSSSPIRTKIAQAAAAQRPLTDGTSSRSAGAEPFAVQPADPGRA